MDEIEGPWSPHEGEISPIIRKLSEGAPDLNLSLGVGGVSGQAPSIGYMARDNVSQPSGGYNRLPTLKNIFPLSGHERLPPELMKVYTLETSETLWNSSHEVRGVVSGQPPSISDMARENMSSGGTHSYSRDHSAPSWNALHIGDSSPMMIDNDYMQESVGDKYGWNDSSEVSSKA